MQVRHMHKTALIAAARLMQMQHMLSMHVWVRLKGMYMPDNAVATFSCA